MVKYGEKKMETTILGYRGYYRGYIGIMEKKIETTIMLFWATGVI